MNYNSNIDGYTELSIYRKHCNIIANQLVIDVIMLPIIPKKLLSKIEISKLRLKPIFSNNQQAYYHLNQCLDKQGANLIIRYCDIEKYPELYEYYAIKYMSLQEQ